MNKKLMLLVNPVSGKGSVRTAIFDILSVFAAHGYVTELYMTQKRGDATLLAAAHGGDYDLLVCVGGDGTLSETLAGLVSVEKRPQVGYIAMGTCNDVSKTLQLSKDARIAAEEIMDGRVIPFDVGRMNDDHFCYVAAFGAFTDVSYSTPQKLKKALGHFAYVLAGTAQIFKIRAEHCRIELGSGEILEGDYLFGGVTNSTSVAGLMRIERSAVDLGDGLFEVVLVPKPHGFADVRKLAKAVLTRTFTGQNVTLLHTDRVHFTFDDPVAWTRDGEAGGGTLEVLCENIPQAIGLTVPPEIRKER